MTKTVNKPWGHYKNLAQICGSNIKTITVKPGERLSLQSHKKRDEIWIVLAGAIIAETKFNYASSGTPILNLLQKGGQVKIFKDMIHRMACYGKEPAVVLEVSLGEHDEEDIERYEDDYGRQGTTTI